jgi:hypothetical protein
MNSGSATSSVRMPKGVLTLNMMMVNTRALATVPIIISM